jgi:flagellar hook-associated protein 1 FlgK
VAPNDPNFMTTGLPRIVTVAGHATLTAGGTAGGQLNVLTGMVPTYRDQLDTVARNLANQVNAQQATGYDATGTHGSPMFGSTSGPITAASITLTIADPAQIAASLLGKDSLGKPATDGGNADAMSQLGAAAGSPDAGYRSLITQLGVQAQSTSRSLATQTTVTSTVDANRQSVSGVSVDEEMTNMLSYQQSYSAAARLVTAIDQNLDTLINHMGLVGNA